MSYQNSSVPLPRVETKLLYCAGKRCQVCIWERRMETGGSPAAQSYPSFHLLEQASKDPLWNRSTVSDSGAQQQEGTQRGQSRRCGSTAYSEHSPPAQSELDLYNFGISDMWEEGSPRLLISSELGREIWRNFLRSPQSKQNHPSQRQSVAVCMGLHLPGWIKGCWTPTDFINGGTDTSFIQNTNAVVFLCSTGLESNTVTGLFF